MKQKPRSWTMHCICAVLPLFLLTACGTPGAGPDQPDGTDARQGPTAQDLYDGSPPAATQAGAHRSKSVLDIFLDPGTGADTTHYHLECVDGRAVSSSTHPEAGAACTDLVRLGSDFLTREPDPDLYCTQQYGGPQTARVRGVVDNEAVDATFSMRDGCEISRWKEAGSLLAWGASSKKQD